LDFSGLISRCGGQPGSTEGFRISLKEALNNLYYSPTHFGDKGKEHKIGGACSTHGGDEKFLQNFCQEI
jgi:hypothetical protein